MLDATSAAADDTTAAGDVMTFVPVDAFTSLVTMSKMNDNRW